MTKKELKKMNYEDLENFVLDMADDLWGVGYAGLRYYRKNKNLWVLEVEEESFHTECSSKELCLLDFYEYILDEISEENERLAEAETRASYDRWFGQNNGVGYGKF